MTKCHGTTLRHTLSFKTIVNSKSKYGINYKSALDLANLGEQKYVLREFMTYLLSLKAPNGIWLHTSKRKTFILKFISTSEAILELSTELLSTDGWLLTFSFFNDLLEMLFSNVRRMFGFNNKPNVIQFRSAIRTLLCKQAVQASKAANVLDCEATTGVFKLQWPKRTTPIQADEINLSLTRLF